MRASWLLVGLLASTASCSLAGLDHFRVGSCAGNCAQLNTRDGLDPSGCHAWQCDATGEFCELPRTVDRDHDGFSPIACGGTDCNDQDRDSVQGAVETCDGLDNDCNGIVDDVTMASSAPTPVPVVTGATAPTFVTYADAADGVVVGFRTGSSTAMVVVDQIDGASTAHPVTGTASAMPEQALTSSAASPGCPLPTLVSLAPPTCDATHACTTPTWRCVTAGAGQICEPPVTNHSPLHPMECTTNTECQDGLACNGREVCDPTGPAGMLDARGCRAGALPCATAACDELHDQCITSSVGACTFGDLALAPIDGNEWLTLAVTTDGCTDGRLRTGTVDASAPAPAISFWGDHRMSTTWAGVDLDAMGCTGASRRAGDVVGAAGIAVAGLAYDVLHDRPITEGLAAWRAAPVCSGVGGCASPASASIEVLGLWREAGHAGASPIRWVDGSDDGRGVRLTDSASSARASVVSWALASGTAGYTIAYGRAGGGVALSFVSAFTASPATALAPACTTPTPPVCLAPDGGPDGVVHSSDDGESLTQIAAPGTSRTTPSLGTPIPEVIQPTTTVVGDVSVVTGAVSGATVPLALAWATSTDVVLAHVTFDPATNMISEGASMHFPSAGARDVALVHLAAGLVEAAAPRPTGGLVLTWSTSDGTFAVRVLDDGDAIVSPGVVRLGATSDHPRAFLDTTPAVGTAPPTVRARVIAHVGDAFVAFPTVCGAAL